jgi:hypothetical protein
MGPLDVLLTQIPYNHRPRVKTDVEALIGGATKIGALLPKIGDFGMQN